MLQCTSPTQQTSHSGGGSQPAKHSKSIDEIHLWNESIRLDLKSICELNGIWCWVKFWSCGVIKIKDMCVSKFALDAVMCNSALIERKELVMRNLSRVDKMSTLQT